MITKNKAKWIALIMITWKCDRFYSANPNSGVVACNKCGVLHTVRYHGEELGCNCGISKNRCGCSLCNYRIKSKSKPL